jgi:signal transduction histidine kinase
MLRLFRSLATRLLDPIIILLTIACAALLFLWQSADLRRGTQEYRRAMIDQADAWYNQLDLPFFAFEELFSIHQGLGPEAEARILWQRLSFLNQTAKAPGLIKTVFKVTSTESATGVGSAPRVEELRPGGYRGNVANEWRPIALLIAKQSSLEMANSQSPALLFNQTEPYLAIYSNKAVQFLLVFDKEIFFTSFMDSITRPILARMENAVAGFVPALVYRADDSSVLYAAERAAKRESPYLAMPLDGFEAPAVNTIRRDPRLIGDFAELRLERSFFLEMWLRGVPASSLFSEDQVSIDRRGSDIGKGVYLAYLPQHGSIERLVLDKRLPVFMLGYIAIAMIGLALLLVSRYNRGMRRLVVQQEEFVSTITHELRTPLHVITIGASNLADGIVKDAKDIERYGGMLKGEAQRLGRMVESILSYSGITNRALSWQKIDVDGLFEEVMAPFRVICREQSIELEEKFIAQRYYCGDSEAIRLILSNLLSNAIKHAGEGRWIRVTAKGSDELALIVQDRGPGIPKRDIGRITEPFYRCSSTGSQHGFSKGLGLSIVKRILDAEGGDLAISSVEGKGSSFTARLPYCAIEASEYNE